MKEHKQILLISRAIAGPWDEGTKNICKGLVDYAPDKIAFLTNRNNPYGDGYQLYTSNGISRGQKLRLAWFLLVHPLASYEKILVGFSPSLGIIRLFKLLFRWKGINQKKQVVQFIPSLAPQIPVDRAILSDHLVVISDHTYERIMMERDTHVCKIRPFIAPLSEDPLSEEITEWKKIISYDPTKKYILYLGEYSQRLGSFPVLQDIILDTNDPGIVYILACRIFSPQEKRYEESLKNICKAQQANNVIFLNHVNHIHGLIAMSDLMIFPTSSSGNKFDIPLVLLEALHYKVPVLLSATEPFCEVYAYDTTLYQHHVVPKHDAEVWREYIQKTLGYGYMGHTLHDYVERYFGSEKQISILYSFITGI